MTRWTVSLGLLVLLGGVAVASGVEFDRGEVTFRRGPMVIVRAAKADGLVGKSFPVHRYDVIELVRYDKVTTPKPEWGVQRRLRASSVIGEVEAVRELPGELLLCRVKSEKEAWAIQPGCGVDTP